MHTVHHWEQLLACRTSCICLSGCCLVKVQAHSLVSGGNYPNLRSEFFHFYVLLLSVPFSHAWLFFTKITYLLHSERGIQMLFVTRINRNKFAILVPRKMLSNTSVFSQNRLLHFVLSVLSNLQPRKNNFISSHTCGQHILPQDNFNESSHITLKHCTLLVHKRKCKTFNCHCTHNTTFYCYHLVSNQLFL